MDGNVLRHSESVAEQISGMWSVSHAEQQAQCRGDPAVRTNALWTSGDYDFAVEATDARQEIHERKTADPPTIGDPLCPVCPEKCVTKQVYPA